MPNTNADWLCPTCGLPLRTHLRTLKCANGHSFDLAKEGYVNLLLAHQKNSKQPGDNKAMIAARHAFLTNGHYASLAEEMAELIAKNVDQTFDSQTPVHIFDAGCGEGYYLQQVVSQLSQNTKVRAKGIDISKFAVQKAAKQFKDAQFAVASTYAIPLPDASQNVVLQVFVPSDEQEIRRVLSPGGLWLRVNPAPNHLIELKRYVYDSPELHEVDDTVPTGFSREASLSIRFTINLAERDCRQHLLMMTPFYWQISEKNKQSLLTDLTCATANFHISLLQAV